MSEFKFTCPDCSQKVLIDAASSGRRMDCPSCGCKFVVPPVPKSKDVLPVAQRVTAPVKPAPAAASAKPKAAAPKLVKPAPAAALKQAATKPATVLASPAATKPVPSDKRTSARTAVPVVAPAPGKVRDKLVPKPASKPVPVKIPKTTEAKAAPTEQTAGKPQTAPKPVPAVKVQPAPEAKPVPKPVLTVKIPSVAAPKAAPASAPKPVAVPAAKTEAKPAPKPVPEVKIPAVAKVKPVAKVKVPAPEEATETAARVAVMTSEVKLAVVRGVRSRIADAGDWLPGKSERGEYRYAAKLKEDEWETVPASDPEATRFSLFGAVMRELAERNVVRASEGRREFLDEELPAAIQHVLGREVDGPPPTEAERGALTHKQCLAVLTGLEERYQREAEDAQLVESRTKVEEVRLSDLVDKLEQKSNIRAEDVARALYHEVEELKRHLAKIETGLAQALKPRTER